MNKKVLAMLAILLIPTVFALAYFGQVQRNVTITSGIDFTGDNAVDIDDLKGGENVVSEDLKIVSVTSVNAPIDIITTHTLDNEGCTITDTENFLMDSELIAWGVDGYLSADFEAGREEITIITEYMTLADLVSIDFEEYVETGYPVSVNILLDINGDGIFESKKDLTTGYLTEGVDEVLKIEWAYNGATAGYPDAYMENEDYNNWNFEGVSSIDDTTEAWIYSVKPGDVEMIKDTLANFKSGISRGTTCYEVSDAWKSEACDNILIDENTVIYGIQIESLGFIAASNSQVKNLKINNVAQEITLLPERSIEFNVESEYGLLCEGSDTVVTTVTERS